MKNFVKQGNVMTFTATSGGVTSGSPVIIGSMFLIPTYDAADGEECEGATVGVYKLPKKPTDHVLAYEAAYWDGTQVTNKKEGNKKIGVFDAIYKSGDIFSQVRLDGVSIKDLINVAEQWVAQLDGAMQYWQLTEEIPVPYGGSIELDLMYDSANKSAIDYVFTSENSSKTSLFFTAMEFLKSGSSGYISEIFVDGESTGVMPYNNAFHKIKCTVNGGLAKVGILAARFDHTRTSSGTIKMFRVRNSSGVIVNEIPLTNKAQGATQLATVGNVNAFMPNYTEAVWRKL